MKLVPVHKDDFKKINEFAEAAWIYRDPNNSDNITLIRRNLLREVIYITWFFCNTFLFQHNAQVIKTLQEKEENKNLED